MTFQWPSNSMDISLTTSFTASQQHLTTSSFLKLFCWLQSSGFPFTSVAPPSLPNLQMSKGLSAHAVPLNVIWRYLCLYCQPSLTKQHQTQGAWLAHSTSNFCPSPKPRRRLWFFLSFILEINLSSSCKFYPCGCKNGCCSKSNWKWPHRVIRSSIPNWAGKCG